MKKAEKTTEMLRLLGKINNELDGMDLPYWGQLVMGNSPGRDGWPIIWFRDKTFLFRQGIHEDTWEPNDKFAIRFELLVNHLKDTDNWVKRLNADNEFAISTIQTTSVAYSYIEKPTAEMTRLFKLKWKL